MIQSMTGFGRGEAANDRYKITIEIKSVNHRYLDVTVRLPRKLNSFESVLRTQIKDYANRGKVDIYVNVEEMDNAHASLCYHPDIAAAYLRGIYQISDEFSLPGEVTATTLSQYPEVFTTEETVWEEDKILPILKEAMFIAGENFCQTRITEGIRLGEDIKDKLFHIGGIVDCIEKRYPQLLAEHRQRLTDKVYELLGDTQIDEGVLATELVVYSDKICVDEELVRLRTHIKHLQDTLEEDNSIGRKLDFIIQEMNREANTTLSKANDVEVSNLGIELKTEIEKIREQIQNIE